MKINGLQVKSIVKQSVPSLKPSLPFESFENLIQDFPEAERLSGLKKSSVKRHFYRYIRPFLCNENIESRETPWLCGTKRVYILSKEAEEQVKIYQSTIYEKYATSYVALDWYYSYLEHWGWYREDEYIRRKESYETFWKKHNELQEKEKVKKKTQKIKSSINNGGIYGIYLMGELIYIGLTTRDFQSRWNEHLDCIKNQKELDKIFMYSQIDSKDADNLEFRVLESIDDLYIQNLGRALTLDELKIMEYSYIRTLKPKYNYSGLKKPYQW